jgi:hypothetical protein
MFKQPLPIKKLSLKLELVKGALMRPDPKEYLAQVVDVLETEVVVCVEFGLRGFISLPREMCPEEACVPGGSFYLLTQEVDPDEERKLVTELLGDADAH